MDETLAFLMDEAQIAALSFMAIAYICKVIWILRFKPMRERTPARGSHAAGVMYSYANLAMPWAMESTSKRWWRYLEFALFHLGIAITIGTTFILPYVPELIANPVIILVLQAFIAAAFVAGVIRLYRRITVPEMRLVSSPDDYFSITLLDAYLVSAFFAVPNQSVMALYALFIMTTIFLVYVPFSKISHYLLYPFQRYYIGKHFGHRGVYPKKAHF